MKDVAKFVLASLAMAVLPTGSTVAVGSGLFSPIEAPSAYLSLPAESADRTTPAQPALPRAAVDITMPDQKGATVRVPAGDSRGFQKALNAAKCGDTVVLQAGSVYKGNFTIPNIGSCPGWVVVESSGISSLPSGTRVGPSSVTNMATLTGTERNTPVLQFKVAGIHNFRFIGLEISCATGVCDAPNDLTNGLVEIDGGLPNSIVQTPSHIILDRCYIHGSPHQNIRRGVAANGTNIAVVDSYISEIHESVSASAGDSQAIEDWNGAGPLLIQNNYLEAATENVMLGGAKASITGLIPSDITIVGNYFYKDQSWRNEPAPYNWLIKNILEFKNAQRVLVQGNVLAYCWYAAQAGEVVMVSPRALGGGGWETTADITFTNNLMEHAAIGITIAPSDNNHVPTSQPPQRILIQNNVLSDISGDHWAGSGWALLIEDVTGGANPKNITNWHDLIIDHNDLLSQNKFNCGIFLSGGQGPSATPAGPIQFTNNILVGDFCGQGRAPGERSTSFYYRDLTWDKNLLVGARGTGYSKGTLSLSKISDLGFEHPTSTDSSVAAGQLARSSAYRNAGTDGKDVGLSDWSEWKTATTKAIEGHRD